jgi:ribonuclease BN (tRNA processing enzyme)
MRLTVLGGCGAWPAAGQAGSGYLLEQDGFRLEAAGRVLAYTGPSPAVLELARGADLLLAEASFPERVPADVAGFLSSARQAGEHAAAAGAGRLLLTHLLPGTAPGRAEDAARAGFPGAVGVADLG